MCPGHVPGSRSDTVSERSTTLAPASDVKLKAPPLKFLQVPFGVEAHLFRIADYLGLLVPERLVDQVLGDVEVLQVQCVGDADEARLYGRYAPVATDGRPERLLVARKDHGHLCPLDKGARDDVGVHSCRPAAVWSDRRGQLLGRCRATPR